MHTHNAVIKSSGRVVPVERCGRLLFVLRPTHGMWRFMGYQDVSPCRYDDRFILLPKEDVCR